MIRFVIDTCVLYDYRTPPLLESPEFEVLQSLARRAELKIVIPQLVIDELTNTVRRDLVKNLGKCSEPLRKAAGFLINPSALTHPALDIESAINEYRAALLRRLQELEAEVPGYSNIEHSDLIVRCALKRKPFAQSDGSDRGYKDTLLWETVLRNVASQSESTILVSKNTRDFADPENKDSLHPDLIADLQSQGLPEAAVRYCPSLKSSIRLHAEPLLTKIEESGVPDLEDLLARFNNSIPIFLDDHIAEIQEKLREVLEAETTLLDETVRYGIYGVYSVSIQSLPEEFEPDSGSVIESDESYISYYLEVEANIELMLDKSDACNLSRTTQPAVREFDWNRHCSLVGIDVTLAFSLDIVADLRKGDVVKWSIPLSDVAVL